jgi:hypothetical protein
MYVAGYFGTCSLASNQRSDLTMVQRCFREILYIDIEATASLRDLGSSDTGENRLYQSMEEFCASDYSKKGLS